MLFFIPEIMHTGNINTQINMAPLMTRIWAGRFSFYYKHGFLYKTYQIPSVWSAVPNAFVLRWGVHFLGPFKDDCCTKSRYPSWISEHLRAFHSTRSRCVVTRPTLPRSPEKLPTVSSSVRGYATSVWFHQRGLAWALSFPVLLVCSACRSSSCTDRQHPAIPCSSTALIE